MGRTTNVMVGFYILASLVIIQGVVALLDGLRYLRYVRESLAQPPAGHQTEHSPYTPKVAVIAPCKGIDPGFRGSVQSLLGQDYPDYEVIFVTESRTDPAYHQIWRRLQDESHPGASLIEAGLAQGQGQKVHNLLRALDQVSDEVQVFAFADSDATTASSWLRSLVAPLVEPGVGATTGYRWYVPARGNVCSLLRSMWNASIATALGPHRRNFAWGGSTAIGRDTFEAADVRQRWSGACTEDYPLSNAVKEQGLTVKFVPQCLVPSRGACKLGELLRFTTRQIVLTRVYSPRLWWLALLTNLMFFGAFYGGLGIMLGRLWAGVDQGVIPALVGLVYLPGVVKGVLRQKAVKMILADVPELGRHRLISWFLYPLANLIYIYNFAVSTVSRRIRWRGILYELVSPTETLILGQEEARAGSDWW